LSGFDVRQRLVISYVYELPFGRGKSLHPVANWFISGWEVSGITQFQGGYPFTVAMSDDRNGDGIPDRPDLVGPVTIQSRNPNCYIVDSHNRNCGATSSAFVDLPAGSLRFRRAGSHS